MKTRARPVLSALAILGLLFTINSQLSTLRAQGTAFMYQGKLDSGGSPANGSYDIDFTLYPTNSGGTAVAGPLTNVATGVTNGLFTVILDFGPGVFTGSNYWLDIAVSTNGANTFTELVPRQPLLPVPYAIMANGSSNLLGTLSAGQLTGTLPAGVLNGFTGTVTLTNGGNTFSGMFSGSFGGSGAGLTNVPGTVAWQTVSGTNQQAQPNMGYIANNTSPVTITLPPAPNIGDIVSVSGAGPGGWIIGQNTGQSIQAAAFGVTGTNWDTLTNWMQTSAPIESWSYIASSADGTKLAATINPFNHFGGIYMSTNSGITWSAADLPEQNWSVIAFSGDGTKLFAGYDYYDPGPAGVTNPSFGGLVFSTNSGITWGGPADFVPEPTWRSLVSSADGTKLASTLNNNNNGNWEVWTSTNSGASWMDSLDRFVGPTFPSIASSADGAKLVASGGDGLIYASTNSGLNWTQTNGPRAWVASSADGTKLVAAVLAEYGGGGIYTSTNSGNTWIQEMNAPSTNWSSIASSADGTKLAAAGEGGIYNSFDSGVTWIQSDASFSALGYIASSTDGTRLAAAGSGIWTAQAAINSTTPGPTGYLTGGQGSAITLQYIGNGQWQPLSYSGTITADDGPSIGVSGYVHSYSTATQAVVTASMFQSISNNADPQISGWLHTPGTISYTNTQTGLYLVQYTAESITTASVTTTVSLRALDNGTEIPDSQSTVVANTANQTVPISKSFIASFNSGDVLQFQFAGSSTDDRLVSNFGLGTTRPSFSCTIVRIQ